MSVKDSPQARRSGTQIDKGVGLIVTNGRATGKEPSQKKSVERRRR